MCLVTVQGDGKFEITQSKYRLTEEQKHDDGQKLFDFCAECLKIFIDSSLTEPLTLHLGSGGKIPLGFTVSKLLLQSVLRHLLIAGLKTVLVSLHVSRAYHRQCILLIVHPFLSQSRIDQGILIRWTKGFGAGNTEGHDVAEMFRKSLEKHVGPFTILFFSLIVHLAQ